MRFLSVDRSDHVRENSHVNTQKGACEYTERLVAGVALSDGDPQSDSPGAIPCVDELASLGKLKSIALILTSYLVH